MTIKRPEVAQLDAIFATVAEIHRAEARLADLKKQVAQEARALAEIPDKRLRIEAGFYAYWFAPEVAAKDIALGATGRPHPARLMKLAGAVSIGVPCDRCKEDLPIRSRSQMNEILELSSGGPWPSGHHRLLCIPCQNALDEERWRERGAELDAHDLRQAELATMSYAEYLKTPEFQEARDLHLWWLADGSHTLECETCNGESSLGVYHKAPGDEAIYGDVILLCATCRDALVAAGKLIPPPPEGNLIPPELGEAVRQARRAELSY
jgi:hypothetical protein